MKAMIFAAGLGTRLRPLTNDRPKALVAVNGTPLLAIVIHRLKAAGCTDILVNVHHYPDMVIDFLQREYFLDNDIRIHISDEREELLETGGGLKKAASFFQKSNESFIVHNTDIVSNINLKQLYQTHQESKAIATLAVRERETSRYLLFDEDEAYLKGWTNVKTEEFKWSRSKNGNEKRYAFSGIHVLSPQIFDYMPEKNVFSIIDTYLTVASKEDILAYPHTQDIWLDAGKPAQILEAEKILSEVME